MKFSNAIFSLMLGVSVNGHAMAGGVDGGGGIGVRCLGGSAPKNFELLDLQEARINGRSNSYHPQSETEAIDLTTSLFTNLFWNPDTIPMPEYQARMKDSLRPLFEGGTWTDPSNGKVYRVQFVSSLPLSDDIGNYHILPGCHLEQVAYFDDVASTLSIANNWNDLDWVDRAALISHEMAYFMDRREGMEYFGQNIKMTSEKARAFVGDLFSTLGVTAHADSVPAGGFAKCSDSESNDANSTYGYNFDDGSGNATIVFNVIHGRSSAYQMKASFSGVPTSAFADLDNGVFTVSAPLQFVGEQNTPSFVLRMTKSPGQPITFELLQDQSGTLTPVAQPQSLTCWYPN